MFGREYLDWTDEQAASRSLDAYLAELPAHERKWVLAVMRKRFEVRVEFKDHPLNALSAASQRNLFEPRHHGGQSNWGSHVGGTVSQILGL